MPNVFDKLFGFLNKKDPVTPPVQVQPVVTKPRDPHATVPLPEISATASVGAETIKSVGFGSATKRLTMGIAQHVGRVRTHNEDVLLVFTGELAGLESMPNFGVFVVADGMGGHALGERASGIAARRFAQGALEGILPYLLADPGDNSDRPPLNEVLESAMSAANQAVFKGVPEGGGTTLTCAVLIGQQILLSHVGDSRAYIITPDGFEQITRDHSLVQRLQELGQLSAAEAAIHPQRNVLYRAVGQGDGLEIDLESRQLAPGSSLLLCSDGLWGLVPDERLIEIARQSPSPQAACEAMVNAANNAGGPDNITAVMVQLPA